MSPTEQQQTAPAAGWAAAVWAGLFGALHLFWVLGGRWGLGDPAAAELAFERVWFLGFNLLAAVACGAAAVLALATIGYGRRFVSDRVLVAGLMIVTSVLLLRGGVGVVQVLLSQRTEAEAQSPVLVLYDPWFVLGGLLFGLVTWCIWGPQNRRDWYQ